MKNKKLIILIICITILFIISNCKTSEINDCNAPEDHIISKDGICHKEGLNNPLNDCTACHGNDLRGNGDTPSCYKCHGKKW